MKKLNRNIHLILFLGMFTALPGYALPEIGITGTCNFTTSVIERQRDGMVCDQSETTNSFSVPVAGSDLNDLANQCITLAHQNSHSTLSPPALCLGSASKVNSDVVLDSDSSDYTLSGPGTYSGVSPYWWPINNFLFGGNNFSVSISDDDVVTVTGQNGYSMIYENSMAPSCTKMAQFCQNHGCANWEIEGIAYSGLVSSDDTVMNSVLGCNLTLRP